MALDIKYLINITVIKISYVTRISHTQKFQSTTMTSKIPEFTSSKIPSSSSEWSTLLHRRGNETTSAAAAATTTMAEKRPRTTYDAEIGTEFYYNFYDIFSHFNFLDSCCSKQAYSL